MGELQQKNYLDLVRCFNVNGLGMSRKCIPFVQMSSVRTAWGPISLHGVKRIGNR